MGRSSRNAQRARACAESFLHLRGEDNERSLCGEEERSRGEEVVSVAVADVEKANCPRCLHLYIDSAHAEVVTQRERADTAEGWLLLALRAYSTQVPDSERRKCGNCGENENFGGKRTAHTKGCWVAQAEAVALGRA